MPCAQTRHVVAELGRRVTPGSQLCTMQALPSQLRAGRGCVHTFRNTGKVCIIKGAQQRKRTGLVHFRQEGLDTLQDKPANSDKPAGTDAAAPAGTAAPQTELQPGGTAAPQFNWFKAWYPVKVLEDLDPAVPHAVTLLGQQFVVWRDAAGTWRCFRDACPHRLAPLSEGRIEPTTGNLFCNYHGWQFGPSGACTNIPQVPGGCASNPRASCAQSFPTKAAEGLLWVWPDGGAAADQEAAAAFWPGVAPELDQYKAAAYGSSHRWYYRDIPVSWFAARENAFNDPGHETVLHHGAGPFLEREKAQPRTVKRTAMDVNGYTISITTPQGYTFTDAITMPCGSRRAFAPNLAGVSYVVPTAPGRCLQLHTWVKPGNSSQTQVHVPWQQAVKAALTPTWVEHLAAGVFLDADIAMQGGAGNNRARGLKPYMPAQLDLGPASLALWLRQYGGGGPPVSTLVDPLGGTLPGALSREQLLDRFHQHTQHCTSCRQAHATATRVQALAKAAAQVLLAAAIGVLAAAGKPLVAGLLILAAAAAAGVSAAAAKLVQQLVFVDYDYHHVSKQ